MSQPSILIVFSNPEDSGRLRLDREQRILDEIQRKYNTKDTIRILSAATIEDLINSLRQPFLRIVHFSGHGSPHGVYFEASPTSGTGVELASDKLAGLINSHAPQVEALILASCYSADSNLVLRQAAPYVITVEGPADDNAAIKFTKSFYENFFESQSVEISLTRTQIELQSLELDEGLQIYVTRRGEYLSKDRVTLQSIKRTFDEETFLIDVTDINDQIDKLDMPKGKFLSLLANKIYIHKWLYYSSFDMEYAVFPIGKYFAIFSWKHGMDLLVCRRILRLKEKVPDEQCDLWMRLSFRYCQLFSLQYRRERQAIYPGINKKLEFAIRQFGSCVTSFFENRESLSHLKNIIPEQIKMAVPLLIENYNAAQESLHQEDYSQVIVHLETTLSLIHGILDGLVDELAA
ncbi:MAG TPA: CHAT domain-containing protein [Blastocatellia bacterium]|nr:CHAT domain-containing protein [Blastocatellia bacterium]